MKKSFLISTTMVLFLVSCTQKSTDKVSSSLNFEKGFTQTIVYETETSASQMGSFQEMNVVKFQLDEITNDSAFVFTGKVTRMQYTSDMFGEKESVDTDNVNTDGMSSNELDMYTDIKRYVNEEFTFTLNKYGNVIKSSEFKNKPSYIDPSVIGQYTTVPTMSFPKEKLAVGTTWEYNTTNPLIASQKIKFVYTIDDISKDKIFIDVNMTIDGIAGMLKKSTAKGTYEIDRNTKRFIKGERTMNIQTGGGKVTYKIYEQ
ncbi:MAG: hypothetical protein AB8B65_04785 [Kordia sp.]|uniref:hypothetical protein n=1 Tax=Kordia sp. TaxID=1965332 RepID=UPI003859713F